MARRYPRGRRRVANRPPVREPCRQWCPISLHRRSCRHTSSCRDAESRAGQDGAWLTPVSLGSRVNSRFVASTPWLSADARTMYFSSSRPGVGGSDLWVSRLVKKSPAKVAATSGKLDPNVRWLLDWEATIGIETADGKRRIRRKAEQELSGVTEFKIWLVSMKTGKGKIDDEVLRRVSLFADLEELNLERANRVTEVGVRHLEGLTKLKRLRFNSSSVNDKSLESIGKLGSLEDLAIWPRASPQSKNRTVGEGQDRFKLVYGRGFTRCSPGAGIFCSKWHRWVSSTSSPTLRRKRCGNLPTFSGFRVCRGQ